MYFPFLRGKQNELLALRECAEKLSTNGKVVPIIEPVTKGFSPILKCINTLCDKKIDSIIVYNSQNGDIGKSSDLMKKLVGEIKSKTKAQHFAFIINSSTKEIEVNDFLKDIGGRKYSFIHSSAYPAHNFLLTLSASPNFGYHIFIDPNLNDIYKKQFSNFSRVNIRNCFRSVNKNSEYADPNHELFTDAHLTYINDGFSGFGDYTTLPEKFKSSGFQPYTAALHLTHEVSGNNEIWVRHFLSNVYEYPTSDQAALIHEALPEMVKFISNHKDYFSFSESAKEIVKIHKEGRSTNLGYMKKLAIKHHIELLYKIM
ncbi:sce7725 family protein [Aeromonas hydrophila]|uniref:sce7725 family protein n=1 Tax=Aeromonas hydrophila TaxID=644 RepID=UPI003F7AF752